MTIYGRRPECANDIYGRRPECASDIYGGGLNAPMTIYGRRPVEEAGTARDGPRLASF
jgi:hypothetical protein